MAYMVSRHNVQFIKSHVYLKVIVKENIINVHVQRLPHTSLCDIRVKKMI